MENFKTRSIKSILFDPEAFPTNTARKTNSQLVFSSSFEAEVVSSQARPSVRLLDSSGNQIELFSARHTLDIRVIDRYRAGLGGTPGYDFPFNLSAFAIITERNDDGTPKSWQFYKLISLVERPDNQLLMTIESDTEEFSRFATGANAIPDLITEISGLTFFLGSGESSNVFRHGTDAFSQAEFDTRFIEFVHPAGSAMRYSPSAAELMLGNRDILYIGFTQNQQGVIDLPERLTIASDGVILMTQANFAQRKISQVFSSNNYNYTGDVAFYDVNPTFDFNGENSVVVSF